MLRAIGSLANYITPTRSDTRLPQDDQTNQLKGEVPPVTPEDSPQLYLGNALGGTIHREISGLPKAPPDSAYLVRPNLARGTSTATHRVPDPRINLTEVLDRAGINPITHLFQYCSPNIGAISDLI